ncbi:MAG: PilW family protein [Thermodesulfovibrionales bacterium]|nr:PilW family protein [Thermodesulfovibrionales bacterium]
MIKRQEGFTLVELLITMVIFVFTIAAASSIFVPLLTQFKQQSKVAETQIEGVVGLDLLRRDVEQAGFGLPWNIAAAVTTATYSEASGNISPLTFPPSNYNDAPNPPRAILSGDSVGFNGSDYLVIKGTSVATNDAAMKWAYVVEEGGASVVKTWGAGVEDLDSTDRVIVMIPSRGVNNQKILVDSSGVFSVQFQSVPNSAYSPGIERDLYLIYGVDPDTNLRMPFNRAEYYIRGAGGGFTIPPRCAPNTGVLMKSVINQADGARGAGMPLLDCVADMQVVYQLDRDGDGTLDAVTSVLNDTTGTALTARQIREQLKEIRVYILAHEGQKDNTYNATTIYPAGTVALPAAPDPGSVSGSTFNFTTRGVTDWRHYRWKIYRIVVKPNNLRG